MEYPIHDVCREIADNTVKFIEEMLGADEIPAPSEQGYVHAADMDIMKNGQKTGSILLAVPDTVAAALCRKFLGGDGEIQEKLVLSAVNELLNIIVGRSMEFLRKNMPGIVIGLPKAFDISAETGYNKDVPVVRVSIGDDTSEITAQPAGKE